MKKLIIAILSLLFFSRCEEALEVSLTGKKVTLLSPANNMVTTDTLQTFYWQPLNGANAYQLQVVHPSFDSIARLIRDTIIFQNTFTMDLDKSAYQWRVRALNNSTSTDNSDTWNLKIQ